MKHTHCELIKRWAEDTSLVRFYKDCDGCWEQSPILNWVRDTEYFLVCEKHAEVCLHWLNGGEIESSAGTEWITDNYPMFNPALRFRIKVEWKPEIGELCHFYDYLDHCGKADKGVIRKYKQEGCTILPFSDNHNTLWKYCEPLSAVGLKVI